jgi:hypothetical protein
MAGLAGDLIDVGVEPVVDVTATEPLLTVGVSQVYVAS